MSAKRLPKTVVINGEEWRVIRKPLAHRGIDGQCIHRTREIQIDWHLRGKEQEETFLHEIIHACLPELWKPKTEEYMVTRLAPRLLEALTRIGWKK